MTTATGTQAAVRAAPDRRRRSRFVVDLATVDDHAAIGGLLQQPLDGSIRLSLCRDPDLRRAAFVEGDPHHLFVVRDRINESVVACGSRSVRSMWIDGALRRVGYLGMLRRDRRLTGYGHLLRDGFTMVNRTRAADEEPYDLTAIVSDNIPARRLLEANVCGLPCYRPLCQLVTLTISTSGRPGRTPGIEVATEAMLPGIVDCLQRSARRYAMAPWWTMADLRSSMRCRGLSAHDFLIVRRKSRVVGCIARWDQRSFKQAVVDSYAPPIHRWRRVINLGRRLRRSFPLPPPGQILPMAYLSHLAVEGGSTEMALKLVEAARRTDDVSAVILTLPHHHPLIAKLGRRLRPHLYRSTLYAVGGHAPVDPMPPLGTRCPIHVEGATL